MLILLPPSEAKATRQRGRTLNLQTLSHSSLTACRSLVMARAAAISGRPDAPQVLKVSPALRAEIARNTALHTCATMAAAQLYSGVLYEALDLDSLDAASRRRATSRILITSAMFGLVRLGDRIPPYRLSMGVNLPGIGPLSRFWREPLSEALAGSPRRGLIVDTRSSTYAAAWSPTPGSAQATRWVHVTVPGATHMAKRIRGLVARELLRTGADPESPAELPDLLADRFEVALRPPTSSRAPWVLTASERAT
ncbi:MAG: peroxide stress protein YaaA [Ornithinimicrobium sp.]